MELSFYNLRYLKELDKTSYNQRDEGVPDGKDCPPQRKWWHSKLADYFEQSENFDRKVEVRTHIFFFPQNKLITLGTRVMLWET